MAVTVLLLAAAAVWGRGPRKTMADVIFEDVDVEVQPSEEAYEKVKDVDVASVVQLDKLWADDDEDTEMWIRFVRGILRSRQDKLPSGEKIIRWEACGEDVSEEEYYDRAKRWAVSLVTAIEEVERATGFKVNPWGAFATTANEGGFNECSLNYAARRWASQHVGRELIEETWHGRTVKRKVEKKVVDQFRLTYDKETVWRIINHPDYADASVRVKRDGKMKTVHLQNKFDGGPYQLRLSVKKLTRERFDHLMSVYPGVYLGVREMARRAIEYANWHKLEGPHQRPWALWPGYLSASRSATYDRKITSVARWLGARRGEI
jgi:hypothetical protein